MNCLDISNIVTDTRRGTLINVQNILEDEDKLKEVAGHCVLLDVTLMLLADENTELKEKFNKYVSATELRNDLRHVANGYRVRKRRRELERLYRQGDNPISEHNKLSESRDCVSVPV